MPTTVLTYRPASLRRLNEGGGGRAVAMGVAQLTRKRTLKARLEVAI